MSAAVTVSPRAPLRGSTRSPFTPTQSLRPCGQLWVSSRSCSENAKLISHFPSKSSSTRCRAVAAVSNTVWVCAQATKSSLRRHGLGQHFAVHGQTLVVDQSTRGEGPASSEFVSQACMQHCAVGIRRHILGNRFGRTHAYAYALHPRSTIAHLVDRWKEIKSPGRGRNRPLRPSNGTTWHGCLSRSHNGGVA